MARKRERMMVIVFLIPALVLYGLFVLYPVLNAFVTSLYNWRGIGGKTFIGLQNYQKMMHDENFINAIWNTGKYVLLQLPLMLIVAVVLAMLMAYSMKRTKWVAFYRSVLFFPYILPSVAIAMLWSAAFNPISGLLNLLLEAIGLDALKAQWLGQASTAFGSIVWVNIWHTVGFYTILLFVGVLNISQEVIEAAEMDGANRFQTSVFVILPMLKDVLMVAVIFILINTLKIFEMPQLLTAGGPNRSTEPLSLYMFQQAFSNYNFGYASALGVVFFILILAATVLLMRLSKGERG